MVREQPPPVPWLIDGLVVKGMLTILNGREGVKKSLLSQSLAAMLARGESNPIFKCRAGRVVIVDAENGEAEIWRRVHTAGMPDQGITLYAVEANSFELRDDLSEIEKAVEQHKP